MGHQLRRRDILRSAGAAGFGTVTAAAAATPAAAANQRGNVTGAASPRQAPRGGLNVDSEPFGKLPDGRAVERYVLTAGRHLRVAMLTYGATIHSIETPDRHGQVANVALGLHDLDGYREDSSYFGATVGRYANRLAGGTFTLDGTTYQVPTNDEDNALHGGTQGFDSRLWNATEVVEDDRVGVRFSRVSPNGEMGFPGRLSISATYTVTMRGELTVEYEATTDAPTVINVTNHVYLNLAGEGQGTVEEHVLWVDADRYTPIDETLIPTGELASVEGTPFDFRRPRPIGRDLRAGHKQLQIAQGYDHNLVFASGTNSSHPVIRVAEPRSGRRVSVQTDQPGVQFYTANFLDGSLIGSGGRSYRQGDAFCLETQHFPDSPNQPDFPSTVLRPEETFRSTTTYRFEH